MHTKMFIADKIRVGFQQREGTYTGKLAYVIYYDKKGVLRKEASWNSWRNKQIEPVEFENVPTEGFVLNKTVGGGGGHSWERREKHIRIWDPRDFEFEISPENLLFILSVTDCTRGKGLEGKFVYAWKGPDLVLLPEGCLEYQESLNFSQLQNKRVYAKDLIEGATYVTKQNEELVYLGKRDYHYRVGRDTTHDGDRYKWVPNPAYASAPWHERHRIPYDLKEELPLKYPKGFDRRFIFRKGEEYLAMDSVANIAACKSPEPVANFAELLEGYLKSPNGGLIRELFLKERDPITPTNNPYGSNIYYWSIPDPAREGFFYVIGTKRPLSENDLGPYEYMRNRYSRQMRYHHAWSVENGQLRWEESQFTVEISAGEDPQSAPGVPWMEPVAQVLYARNEHGGEFPIPSLDYTYGNPVYSHLDRK